MVKKKKLTQRLKLLITRGRFLTHDEVSELKQMYGTGRVVNRTIDCRRQSVGQLRASRFEFR